MDSSNKYIGIAINQNLNEKFKKMKNLYKFIGCKTDIGIKYLTIAADNNLVIAQLCLGCLYLDSKMVSGNVDKALHYLNLAVEQKNSLAQFQMGFIYYTGKYVTCNKQKGIDLIKLSAEQNNPFAQFSLFCLLILENCDEKSYIESLEYLKKAADQNIPDAQAYLGFFKIIRLIKIDFNKYNILFDTILSFDKSYVDESNKYNKLYEVSKYVEPNFNKGYEFIKKAADQDHIAALIFLGDIYAFGIHVVKDIEKSIFYYKKVADQNNSLGQFLLGQVYILNNRISEGILYLNLSANQNYSYAQLYLGILYMDGEEIEYNIDLAIKYLTLAAENNNSRAQYYLGIIYYDDSYMKTDIKKAIKYFKQSANNGYRDAQHIMGVFYLEGKYEKKNIDDGLIYIRQSLKNKSMFGLFSNGCLYHKGEYVPPDINKAIDLYKDSSNVGFFYAKNNLAMIYKLGYKDQIQKNIPYAIIYLSESSRYDAVSMYNLAHIYLYNDSYYNIDQSIFLLIKSSNNYFDESNILLCIALIKKYGFNIKIICENLIKTYKLAKTSIQKLIIIIQRLNLLNQFDFIREYEKYRNIDFIYDYNGEPISSKEFYNYRTKKNNICSERKNITEDFYKGFNIDIIETEILP